MRTLAASAASGTIDSTCSSRFHSAHRTGGETPTEARARWACGGRGSTEPPSAPVHSALRLALALAAWWEGLDASGARREPRGELLLVGGVCLEDGGLGKGRDSW